MNNIKKTWVKTNLLALCVTSFTLFSIGVQAKPKGADGDNFLYQVEPNNTLEGLSQTYTYSQTNWKTLQKLNNISDPYSIPIGKILKIPLSIIPRSPSSAKVIYVKGIVLSNNEKISLDDQLLENSFIKTGDNSFITLELSDRSQITVLPNTEITLQQLKKFSKTGITDSILDIDKGSIETDVDPDDKGVGRFEIRTPITITGVRGTRLRVSKDDNGAKQEVIKGNVNTKSYSLEKSLDITQGFGASYGSDGKLYGFKKLLSPPKIVESQKKGGSWLIKYSPVSDAIKYRIDLSRDKNGMFIQSSYITTKLEETINSPVGGTSYIYIRAIDNLGLEGNSVAVKAKFPWGITSSDGQPIISGFGLPIQRNTYD